MKVIYSDTHRLHNPPHQFNVDRMGGYSESPQRAERILDALSVDHEIISPSGYGLDEIQRIHSSDYLHFLENVYTAWEAKGGTSSGLVPYTFATRSMNHVPDDPVHSAGHYCFDPQTPIVEGTYRAARSSSDCALTGADLLLSGERVAYALCRPPGHHAARDLYGGYCYLNNAAIAADHLGSRVAIIDIDYHHGNGTQAIFYDRPDILFVSIHGDPNRAYPFFSGAPSEVGAGAGVAANRNYALPADVDDDAYLKILSAAISFLVDFVPDHLVISAGFDIYENDPLGDFRITEEGLRRIGQALGNLDVPTLIVQEGGYNTGKLGACVRSFLSGIETS